MSKRHQLTPASYLVLVRGGQILLQLRSNTGYQDGKYSFVAGHVEAGETFTQAMIREAHEEIGIILEPDDLRAVHIMHRESTPLDGQRNERIDVFFTAQKWQGEITNNEPERCDGLGWFDLDNLPENLVPYIRRVIPQIQNGEFYSEADWN